MSDHDHSTKRAAGAQSRQRILAAAIELFAARGYAGTSMRDIAETVGMTKAALYYHFSSKEEVLEAVTEPLLAEIKTLVQRVAAPPPPTPAELLTRMADALSVHVPLLSSVFNDPSVPRHGGLKRAGEHLQVFELALAGSPSPDGLLRARCAIGAIRAGVVGTLVSDPRFAEPPRGEQVVRLLNHQVELLDDHQRSVIVAAALRALDPTA
jgi:TetR/AcrR family transcriptional regulator, regulator of cefoperazone and chloramphenicol sensitivity